MHSVLLSTIHVALFWIFGIFDLEECRSAASFKANEEKESKHCCSAVRHLCIWRERTERLQFCSLNEWNDRSGHKDEECSSYWTARLRHLSCDCVIRRKLRTSHCLKIVLPRLVLALLNSTFLSNVCKLIYSNRLMFSVAASFFRFSPC